MNVVYAHEQDNSLEYRVKAAYIYNFTQFITWPEDAFESASSPLRICILGKDDVLTHFRSINGKRINGRRLQVEQCSISDFPPPVLPHILYFSKCFSERKLSVIEWASGRPVLTVGEYCPSGGGTEIVDFFLDAHKVRFSIDNTRASRAGLRISSRLLKLSKQPPAAGE